MSLTINTTDNKNIVIDDIKPYYNIKLIMDLISSNLEEELINTNENNTMLLTEDYEITLNSSYFILNKILDYAKHMYIIKDLNTTEQDMYNYINNYLDCKNDIICELLNTSDYLQYDILVDVICEKIADDIQKCDSIETLKKKFNIKNIISEEEERELIKNIQ